MQKKKKQPTYWSFLFLSSACYIAVRSTANINDCIAFQSSLKGGKNIKNKSCKVYKLTTTKKSEECCCHFWAFFITLFLCSITLTFGRTSPIETVFLRSVSLLQSLPSSGSDGFSNTPSSDGISYTLFPSFYSFQQYFLSWLPGNISSACNVVC